MCSSSENRSRVRFEGLEDRRMMSVAGDLGLTDAAVPNRLGFGSFNALPAVQMPLGLGRAVTHSATGGGSTGTGGSAGSVVENSVDISKMVGKYKKGTSLLFSSTMWIKSVSSDGKIVGKVNIPWIATASVRGTIEKTGRFTIRFADMSRPETSRVNGYFKGKMHPSGKYLVGTFKHYYGTNSSSGAAAYTATFTRQ